jgi:hypothetical protein
VLFTGDEPILGPPADFVSRVGLELILHARDVCLGLGITYEPDVDLARRLRDHAAGWSMWTTLFGARWREPTIPGVIY